MKWIGIFVLIFLSPAISFASKKSLPRQCYALKNLGPFFENYYGSTITYTQIEYRCSKDGKVKSVLCRGKNANLNWCYENQTTKAELIEEAREKSEMKQEIIKKIKDNGTSNAVK